MGFWKGFKAGYKGGTMEGVDVGYSSGKKKEKERQPVRYVPVSARRSEEMPGRRTGGHTDTLAREPTEVPPYKKRRRITWGKRTGRHKR